MSKNLDENLHYVMSICSNCM